MTEFKRIDPAAARAVIAAKSGKAGKSPNGAATRGSSYPYWLVDVGSSMVIRYLPDGDETNLVPWVPRMTYTLSYDGVEGGEYPSSDRSVCKLPCLNTWHPYGLLTPDPLLVLTKPLWDGSPPEVEFARSLHPKRDYLCQALVVMTPVVEQSPPDSIIRPFTLNRTLHELSEAGFMDPEYEALPSDIQNGRDFTINVSTQGAWRAYTKSKYSGKTRPMSERELAGIEAAGGLKSMRDLLGPPPTPEAIETIREMITVSLEGGAFLAEKWGQHGFKAYPARDASSNGSAAASSGPASASATAASAALMSALRRKNSAAAA